MLVGSVSIIEFLLTALVVLLVTAIYVAPLVLCAMKDRWWLFGFGLVFWFPALLGALLPGKPGSAWARRSAA